MEAQLASCLEGESYSLGKPLWQNQGHAKVMVLSSNTRPAESKRQEKGLRRDDSSGRRRRVSPSSRAQQQRRPKMGPRRSEQEQQSGKKVG